MLAAHDEVIITRSIRADDAPTTPSRWLERMEAVLHASALKGGLVTTADAEVMAAISACQHLPIQAIEMPRPCPALSLRPKQYSATDFDMLISDPYQIYARKILRLRPLDEMDKRPDNALKGNLIHEILGDFLQRYPGGDLPEDAAEQLCRAADKCFAPYLAHPPGRHNSILSAAYFGHGRRSDQIAGQDRLRWENASGQTGKKNALFR